MLLEKPKVSNILVNKPAICWPIVSFISIAPSNTASENKVNTSSACCSFVTLGSSLYCCILLAKAEFFINSGFTSFK